MGIEAATYVGNLVSSNPIGAADFLSEGDDHIRLIKAALQATFPSATKPFRFPSGIAAQTSTVTVALTDANKMIPVNAASGGVTVNLPAVSDSIYDGLEVIICKSDYSTNLVTIDGNSSDLVNGRTTLVLRRPFQHARLRWNHTVGAWFAQVDSVIHAGTKAYWGSISAPDGWVFANGVGTIGNASSGADVAAAYAEQLFFHCYNAYSDDVCPVSGGRGANAGADFGANKRLTMPDLRGRVIFGNPAMGGVTEATTVLSDAVAGVDISTQGIAFGTQEIALVEGNIPELSFEGDTDEMSENDDKGFISSGGTINLDFYDGGAGPIVVGQVSLAHTHHFEGTVGTADPDKVPTLPPGFIDNVIMSL